MTNQYNILPSSSSDPSFRGITLNQAQGQSEDISTQGASAPYIQHIPYITSGASQSGTPEFLGNQKTQNSDDTTECKNIINNLEAHLQNNQLEPESTSATYKKLLQEQRSSRHSVYVSLLRDTLYSTPTTKKAILRFLANIDYSNTNQEEHDYIIKQLLSDDAAVQRYAINTILCWEHFSDIAALKKINLNNCYLQEILNEFINKQK